MGRRVVLLNCCHGPLAHIPRARRIVKLAARGVEQIYVGLPAFAFRLLGLNHRHSATEAVG